MAGMITPCRPQATDLSCCERRQDAGGRTGPGGRAATANICSETRDFAGCKANRTSGSAKSKG
jgi:hypothetical protein